MGDKVTLSIQVSYEMENEIDAWQRELGDIGKAAFIRMAIKAYIKSLVEKEPVELLG